MKSKLSSIPRPISRQPIPKEARSVFKGRLFEVFQWDQKQFDGSTTTFEKIKRPDTAYVIPISSRGKLLLARQIQPNSSPVVGLLGGRIQENETPEEGACRELKEEAGLVPGRLILWDSFQFLPKLDWAIYIFIAYDCKSTGTQQLDHGEQIDLFEISFDELLDFVEKETFGDLEVALRILRMRSDPNQLKRSKMLFSHTESTP